MIQKKISSIVLELSGPAWKRSFLIWVLCNVLLIGLGIAAQSIHGPVRPANFQGEWSPSPVDLGWRGALEGIWVRWDANYYIEIAKEGYTKEVLSVFFPLYPLLGRAVGGLLGGDELAGLLLVSRLAFLPALVVLYKMAAEKFGDEVATFAILFTALYPMGVYWFAPYPLSLALLFSMLSLHWAMQRRWLPAALVGLAAGLTHGTTIPLTLGLFTAWLLQVRKEPRAWLLLPAVGTPPLGMLLFFAYRIGIGLPPINDLLATIWLRVMQPPWMIVADFQRFFLYYLGHVDGWINLALFLFGVGMIVVCIRRLEPPLWVYHLSLVVYICSTTNYTTPFGSYGRYLMMAFPAFITLPLVVRGKGARLAALVVGFFSMLFLTVVYLEWGWLA